MAYKCEFCGTKLEYNDDDDNYYCPGCDSMYYLDGNTLVLEDSEMEECCVACGSPLYPDCKDSCKMFDD